MTCDPKAGIQAILQGYIDAVEAGGRPFALAEHHTALRAMATARLHDPEQYWSKLHALPLATGEPPAAALKAIARMMPERGLHLRISPRIAGLGSLGRQRFVAVTDWRGGSVAREAKALAPSACLWAAKGKGVAPILYQQMLNTAVRCKDPFVRSRSAGSSAAWRRIARASNWRIFPRQHDEMRLLRAMGWERPMFTSAAVKPRTVLADLKKRPRGWLFQAARAMEKAVLADFKAYSAK